MAKKFDAAEFLQEITFGSLKGLVKAQLIEVASHVGADITQCSRKKEIFNVVVSHLGLRVGKEDELTPEHDTRPGTSAGAGRVDSTRIELAKLELEKERMRAENLRLEEELMRRKIELTQAQASNNNDDRPSVSRVKGPDISEMANSVPRFEEEDVDSFFFSFERIARNLEWDRKYWSMVVQQKLTGKAHAVVSALSDEDADDYEAVKEAVLLVYELVPEAYRQKFRGYRRSSGQSYVEFQREKEILFDRWVRSLKVDLSYESLRELVLMEEFKKSTPPEVRTYLEYQKVRDVRSAAVTVDSYELTHKVKSGSPPSQRRYSNPSSSSMRRWQSSYNEGGNRPQGDARKSPPNSPGFRRREREVTCFHCGEKGHIKPECWLLKEPTDKSDEQTGKTAPNGCVHTTASNAQRRRGVRDKEKERERANGAAGKVDEGYQEFVSHGTVSFGCSKEVSVVILRDTGSIQTLMIGDPKSLPSESYTRKSVSIRDVNGGARYVPLYKVNFRSDVVSGEVVVGVVSSIPMKGISFLLGNDVAGGRVKASSTIPKSPMCEENQGHDDECHKVGHSENSKVKDNLPSHAQISESKGSCGVNEGLGMADLDGTKTKGEHDKARRTPCHHVGQSHFVLRDAKVQSRGRSRLKQTSRS